MFALIQGTSRPTRKSREASWKARARNGMAHKLYGSRVVRRHSGYTLIEVLIVTGLVLIISTIGTVSFLEALREGKEQKAFVKLGELGALEQIYFKEHDRFGTFQDLQDVGYIASQYTEDDTILHDQTAGGQPASAFITDYVLDISATADSFQITARPVMPLDAVSARWRLLGRTEDLRSMYITQDGVVRYATNKRPVR